MFSSAKNHRRRSRNRKTDWQFDSLEPKNLLAGISFDAAAGIATVNGSNSADAVHVLQTSAEISVTYHGVDTQTFSTSELNEVVFFGLGGNDWFKNDTSINVRAFGQDGDDILIGGSNDDILVAGRGND